MKPSIWVLLLGWFLLLMWWLTANQAFAMISVIVFVASLVMQYVDDKIKKITQ